MLDAQIAPASAQYLIHASESRLLRDFLVHAERDPEIRILDSIGPAGQPHTLVVELSAEKARALAQQFRSSSSSSSSSPQLTIEPDQPLTMFDMLSAGPL